LYPSLRHVPSPRGSWLALWDPLHLSAPIHFLNYASFFLFDDARLVSHRHPSSLFPFSSLLFMPHLSPPVAALFCSVLLLLPHCRASAWRRTTKWTARHSPLSQCGLGLRVSGFGGSGSYPRNPPFLFTFIFFPLSLVALKVGLHLSPMAFSTI